MTDLNKTKPIFDIETGAWNTTVGASEDSFVGGHAVVFTDKFPMPMGRNYIVDYRFSDNYKKKRNAQRKARAITRKHRK